MTPTLGINATLLGSAARDPHETTIAASSIMDMAASTSPNQTESRRHPAIIQAEHFATEIANSASTAALPTQFFYGIPFRTSSFLNGETNVLARLDRPSGGRPMTAEPGTQTHGVQSTIFIVREYSALLDPGTIQSSIFQIESSSLEKNISGALMLLTAAKSACPRTLPKTTYALPRRVKDLSSINTTRTISRRLNCSTLLCRL